MPLSYFMFKYKCIVNDEAVVPNISFHESIGSQWMEQFLNIISYFVCYIMRNRQKK